jgi:hypothetical protein
MSRLMSCALTIDAVRNRTKTVTRRSVDSWKTLKIGDHLTLVEKGMGIPKGGKVVRLAEVEVMWVGICALEDITPAEVKAEGFPGKSPQWFIDFWLSSHPNAFEDCAGDTPVRRIEWRYLEASQL